MSELQIEYRSPAQLRERKHRFRCHSDKQIDFGAQILRTYNARVPVLIDDNDQVVDGELILMAARRVGLNHIPVIVVKDLGEAQLRKYAIMINKLAEMTEIDEEALALELADISDLLGEPDLSDLGFADAELDRLLGRTELDQLDDEAPPVPDPARPVAKVGDLFLLGPHRLLCGDALKAESYATLHKDERAQFVFSDVPYNLKSSAISGNGRHKHPAFVQASGELSEAEFVRFLTTSMRHMRDYSVDGSLHAIFMSCDVLP